jgi:hypothetical protein
LNAEEPASGGILEEAGDEADETSRLGAAPERQQHRQDQGQIRGRTGHAQGRHNTPLSQAAAEGHEKEQRAHHATRRD